MSAPSWQEWDPSVFARAKLENKGIFLRVASRVHRSSADWDALLGRPEVARAVEGLVYVRVDADERPDAAARYGLGAALLSPGGALVASLPMSPGADLARAISAARARLGAPEPEAPAPPVWTGAVGPRDSDPELHAAWPSAVLASIPATKPGEWPCLDCLEFLLYAACEWKDQAARKRLTLELAALSGASWHHEDGGFSSPDRERSLPSNARLARLYWDAFFLTNDERFSKTASAALRWMTDELFDPARGAFMNVKRSDGRDPMYADGNAMAALALLKSAAFEGGRKHIDAANHTLGFLTQLFDPRRGLSHFWSDGPGPVYGLLSDHAWAILAFSEAFLMAGNKPHREFADALLRHLFQENWERDHGGFLDRAPSAEGAALAAQKIIPHELNAVAFEAAWRMHELKGNPNYRRWAEQGLKHLVPQAKDEACRAAPLARALDIIRRGRVDLELVGRMGDGKTEGFLEAVHRHYLPRKIISFVDPDDQDYLMAHKLHADSYPRLFGCVQLRPKISVDRPDDVPKLLETLAGA